MSAMGRLRGKATAASRFKKEGRGLSEDLLQVGYYEKRIDWRTSDAQYAAQRKVMCAVGCCVLVENGEKGTGVWSRSSFFTDASIGIG